MLIGDKRRQMMQQAVATGTNPYIASHRQRIEQGIVDLAQDYVPRESTIENPIWQSEPGLFESIGDNIGKYMQNLNDAQIGNENGANDRDKLDIKALQIAKTAPQEIKKLQRDAEFYQRTGNEQKYQSTLKQIQSKQKALDYANETVDYDDQARNSNWAYNLYHWLSDAATYGAIGAWAGAGIGGTAGLGIGAVPGAVVGGIIGTATGLGKGIFLEDNQPSDYNDKTRQQRHAQMQQQYDAKYGAGSFSKLKPQQQQQLFNNIDYDHSIQHRQKLINFRNNQILQDYQDKKYWDSGSTKISEYRRQMDAAGKTDTSWDPRDFGYYISGLLGSSMSDYQDQSEAMGVGAASAALAKKAGPWGMVASTAVGLTTALYKNAMASFAENNAEVNDAVNTKIQNNLDAKTMEQVRAAAKSFYVKQGYSSDQINNMTDQDALNLVRSGAISHKDVYNWDKLKKAERSAVNGANNLFWKDEIATFSGDLLTTALEVMPLGYFAKAAKIFASPVAKAAAAGGEFAENIGFGTGGKIIGAAIGAGAKATGVFNKVSPVWTKMVTKSATIADKVFPGLKGAVWKEYAGGIARAGIKSALAEGAEEGVQYLNQQDAQKILDTDEYSHVSLFNGIMSDLSKRWTTSKTVFENFFGIPDSSNPFLNDKEFWDNWKGGLIVGCLMPGVYQGAFTANQTRHYLKGAEFLKNTFLSDSLADRMASKDYILKAKQFVAGAALNNQEGVLHAIDLAKKINSRTVDSPYTDDMYDSLKKDAQIVMDYASGQDFKTKAEKLGFTTGTDEYNTFGALAAFTQKQYNESYKLPKRLLDDLLIRLRQDEDFEEGARKSTLASHAASIYFGNETEEDALNKPIIEKQSTNGQQQDQEEAVINDVQRKKLITEWVGALFGIDQLINDLKEGKDVVESIKQKYGLDLHTEQAGEILEMLENIRKEYKEYLNSYTEGIVGSDRIEDELIQLQHIDTVGDMSDKFAQLYRQKTLCDISGIIASRRASTLGLFKREVVKDEETGKSHYEDNYDIEPTEKDKALAKQEVKKFTDRKEDDDQLMQYINHVLNTNEAEQEELETENPSQENQDYEQREPENIGEELPTRATQQFNMSSTLDRSQQISRKEASKFIKEHREFVGTTVTHKGRTGRIGKIAVDYNTRMPYALVHFDDMFGGTSERIPLDQLDIEVQKSDKEDDILSRKLTTLFGYITAFQKAHKKQLLSKNKKDFNHKLAAIKGNLKRILKAGVLNANQLAKINQVVTELNDLLLTKCQVGLSQDIYLLTTNFTSQLLESVSQDAVEEYLSQYNGGEIVYNEVLGINTIVKNGNTSVDFILSAMIPAQKENAPVTGTETKPQQEQAVSTAEMDKSESAIKEIEKNNEQTQIRIDPDNVDYYIDNQGNRYYRSSGICNYYTGGTGSSTKASDISKLLGNDFDEACRAYFAGETYTPRYFDKEQLYRYLDNIFHIDEKGFVTYQGQKMKPFARDILVHGIAKYTLGGKSIDVPVAGTLDLLLIDKDGVLHVVDFKTANKNSDVRSESGRYKKKQYSVQLGIYKTLLRQLLPGIRIADDAQILDIPLDYHVNDIEVNEDKTALSDGETQTDAQVNFNQPELLDVINNSISTGMFFELSNIDNKALQAGRYNGKFEELNKKETPKQPKEDTGLDTTQKYLAIVAKYLEAAKQFERSIDIQKATNQIKKDIERLQSRLNSDVSILDDLDIIDATLYDIYEQMRVIDRVSKDTYLSKDIMDLVNDVYGNRIKNENPQKIIEDYIEDENEFNETNNIELTVDNRLYYENGEFSPIQTYYRNNIKSKHRQSNKNIITKKQYVKPESTVIKKGTIITTKNQPQVSEEDKQKLGSIVEHQHSLINEITKTIETYNNILEKADIDDKTPLELTEYLTAIQKEYKTQFSITVDTIAQTIEEESQRLLTIQKLVDELDNKVEANIKTINALLAAKKKAQTPEQPEEDIKKEIDAINNMPIIENPGDVGGILIFSSKGKNANKNSIDDIRKLPLVDGEWSIQIVSNQRGEQYPLIVCKYKGKTYNFNINRTNQNELAYQKILAIGKFLQKHPEYRVNIKDFVISPLNFIQQSPNGVYTTLEESGLFFGSDVTKSNRSLLDGEIQWDFGMSDSGGNFLYNYDDAAQEQINIGESNPHPLSGMFENAGNTIVLKITRAFTSQNGVGADGAVRTATKYITLRKKKFNQKQATFIAKILTLIDMSYRKQGKKSDAENAELKQLEEWMHLLLGEKLPSIKVMSNADGTVTFNNEKGDTSFRPNTLYRVRYGDKVSSRDFFINGRIYSVNAPKVANNNSTDMVEFAKQLQTLSINPDRKTFNSKISDKLTRGKISVKNADGTDVDSGLEITNTEVTFAQWMAQNDMFEVNYHVNNNTGYMFKNALIESPNDKKPTQDEGGWGYGTFESGNNSSQNQSEQPQGQPSSTSERDEAFKRLLKDIAANSEDLDTLNNLINAFKKKYGDQLTEEESSRINNILVSNDDEDEYAPSYQIRDERLTEQQCKKVLDHLEAMFGDASKNDEFKENLAAFLGTTSGIAGSCLADCILLSTRMKPGVEYHEAFHRVFELFLNKKTRDSILAWYGRKYGETDPRKAGEALADMFMDYMNNKDIKFEHNIFKRWFKFIANTVKAFVSLGNFKLALLYANINRGQFRGYKASTENKNRFEKVYKGRADFTVRNYRTGQDIELKHCANPTQLRDFVKGLMYEWINEDITSVLGDGIDKLRFDVAGLSRKMSRNDTFRNWVESECEDSPMVAEIFEKGKSIPVTIKNKEGKEVPKMINQFDSKTNRFNKVQATRNEFPNWQAIMPYIDEFMSDMRIETDKSIKEAIEDEQMNINEKNQDNSIGQHIIESIEISPLDRVSRQVKWFFSTIPYVTRVNVERNGVRTTILVTDKTHNSLGYAQFMPFEQIFGKVLFCVAGCKTYSEMISKLRSVGASDPTFEYIANRIDQVYQKIRSIKYDDKTRKDIDIVDPSGAHYDADAESTIIKIMSTLVQHRNDFMWALTGHNKDKERTISMKTTIYQQIARTYPTSWSEDLLLGITGFIQKGFLDKNILKVDEQYGKDYISNMNEVFFGKSGVLQVYKNINASDTASSTVTLIDGSVIDLRDPNSGNLIVKEFVRYCNLMGIGITEDALNVAMIDKRGEGSTNNQLDDICSFLGQKTGVVIPQKFFSSLQEAFDANDSKAVSLLYKTSGFVSQLGTYQGDYDLFTSSLMTLAADNNKYYIISQNNYITDVTDIINKCDPGDTYINGLLNDTFAEHSIIAQQIRENIKRKQQSAGVSTSNIKVHTFVGMKTDKQGDKGRDYFNITDAEDYIAKTQMLSEGYVVFPTLSDKKTWMFLSGVTLPGINILKGIYIVVKTIMDPTTNERYNEFDLNQLGQILNYAWAERDSIRRAIDDQRAYFNEHKQYQIDNYNDSTMNGLFFGQFTGIIDGNGKFISISDKPEIPENMPEEEAINTMLNKAEANLNLADEIFFNGITKSEQISILSAIMKERVNQEIDTALNKGVIKKAKVTMASVYADTIKARQNEADLAFNKKQYDNIDAILFENNGLDADTIKKITEAVLLSRKMYCYSTDQDVINGCSRISEGSYAFQQARSFAIYNYFTDITFKHIMSANEYAACFSGNPAFYNRQYKKGILTDTSIDYTKRQGGEGSTGNNNILGFGNLPGLQGDNIYVCAELKDELTDSTTLNQNTLTEWFRNSEYKYALDSIINTLPKEVREEYYERGQELFWEDSEESNKWAASILQEHKPKLKAILDQKVATEVSAYFGTGRKKGKAVNVADGASYISDEMCERLLRAEGKFDNHMKYAFEVLNGLHGKDLLNKEGTKLYKEILDVVIGTQKYTATGFRTQHVEDGNGGHTLFSPYYNKTALFPVFKQIAYGRMSDLYTEMKGTGIPIETKDADGNKITVGFKYPDKVDMVMMHSAVKIGGQGAVAFKDACPQKVDKDGKVQPYQYTGLLKKNSYVQDLRFIRKQLNTDPNGRTLMNIGTQALKIALSALINTKRIEGSYQTATGRQIFDNIMNCLNELTDLGEDVVYKRFCVLDEKGEYMNGVRTIDEVKLSDYLLQQMNSRNANDNIIQALQLDKNGNMTAPISCTSDINWIDSVVASMVNKEVINVKTPGHAFVQRSVFAMEGEGETNIYNGKELQIRNEKNSMDAVVSIDFFEKIIPNYENLSFEEAKQWLLDNNIIGENADPSVLAYRIPTQALSSISALRFVDVVPILKDTIILPKEFTALTGSDFDIDKLFLTTFNYTKDGKIVSEGEHEDLTHEQIVQNKLVSQYITALQDSGAGCFTMRSIDADTELISSVRDDLFPQESHQLRPYEQQTLSYQCDIKNQLVTGKIGIGPYALNNNNQIYTMMYNIEFREDKFRVLNNLEMTSLHERNDIYDNSILSWLSGFINAHVDIAKDPIVTKLNINQFTYNVSCLLTRLGFGKNALYYLNLPIIRNLAETVNKAGSEYLNESKLSIQDVKKEVQDKFIDDYLKALDKKYGNNYTTIDFGLSIGNDKTKKVFNCLPSEVYGLITDNFNYVSEDLSDTIQMIIDSLTDPDKGLTEVVVKRMLLQNICSGTENADSSFSCGFMTPNLKGLFYSMMKGKVDEDTEDKDKGQDNIMRSCIKGKTTAEETDAISLLALAEWSNFSRSASLLSQLVKFSKIDAEPQGSTLTQQLEFITQFKSFVKKVCPIEVPGGPKSPFIGDIHGLIGMEANDPDGAMEDSSDPLLQEFSRVPGGSFIGAKTFSAINTTRDLLAGASIEATPGFETLYATIKSILGLSSCTEDQASIICNSIIAYYKHKWMQEYYIPQINDERDEILNQHGLFYGNNTIRDRLVKLKNKLSNSTEKAYLLDNLLLKALSPATEYEYIDNIEHAKFITMHKSLTEDKTKQNSYIMAFQELLDDPETKRFAEDLVVYALCTSNDQGSRNIFKYIPLGFLKDHGYVKSQQEDIENLSSKIVPNSITQQVLGILDTTELSRPISVSYIKEITEGGITTYASVPIGCEFIYTADSPHVPTVIVGVKTKTENGIQTQTSNKRFFNPITLDYNEYITVVNPDPDTSKSEPTLRYRLVGISAGIDRVYTNGHTDAEKFSRSKSTKVPIYVLDKPAIVQEKGNNFIYDLFDSIKLNSSKIYADIDTKLKNLRLGSVNSKNKHSMIQKFIQSITYDPGHQEMIDIQLGKDETVKLPKFNAQVLTEAYRKEMQNIMNNQIKKQEKEKIIKHIISIRKVLVQNDDTDEIYTMLKQYPASYLTKMQQTLKEAKDASDPLYSASEFTSKIFKNKVEGAAEKHTPFTQLLYIRENELIEQNDIIANTIAKVLNDKGAEKPANYHIHMTDIDGDIARRQINEYEDHSGGAYGADTEWDIIGRQYGLTKFNHYRDEGNQSLSKRLRASGVKAKVLTKEQIEEARTKEFKLLGTLQPDTLQGNLQVRNYYQVANSDGIFAIATINQDMNGVTGGTNTAVQLGIKMNKEVHVWNTVDEKWYKYNSTTNKFEQEDTPVLTKKFAGIGTRDIENYQVKNKNTGKFEDRAQYLGQAKEAAARQAIRDVYAKTFNINEAVQRILAKDPSISIAEAEKTVATLNNPNTNFQVEEQKSVVDMIGDRHPRVLIASERTDPVFHAQQIKQMVEEELKKAPKDRKFHMMYLITKHDGLPLKELAELKIPKFIHFSITSLGSTKYEPGVMKADDLLDRIEEFIKQKVLNPNLVTIRIDPIIPGVTKKEDVEHIIKRAVSMGIHTFKFSVMDSYGYTQQGVRTTNSKDRFIIQRMEELGYDWDKWYGRNSRGEVNFDAKREYISQIYHTMDDLAEKYNIFFNTCGEKPTFITGLKRIRTSVGCVNVQAMNAVMNTNDIEHVNGNQRQQCSCYGNTVDGLCYNDKCASSCVYCYAMHNSDSAMEYYNEDGTLKDMPLTRTKQTQSNTPSTINIWAGSKENANLSNFAIRPFTIKAGVQIFGHSFLTKTSFQFSSVEQAFQMFKATFAKKEGRDEIVRQLMVHNKPGSYYKALGRKLNIDQKVLDEQWDKPTGIEYDFPDGKHQASLADFALFIFMKMSFDANPQAKKALLDTGKAKFTHNNEKGEAQDITKTFTKSSRFSQLLTLLRSNYQAEENRNTQCQ